MGLFKFLAVGSGLMGLVGRRASKPVELEASVPNFGLRPGLAGQLRETLEESRREDPFGERNHVQERQFSEQIKKHGGPRVRSTFVPSEQGEEEQSLPAATQKPVRRITQQPTDIEIVPPPQPVEEPRVVGAGSLWARKLKIARRAVTRPRGNGVRRQLKQPSVYRTASGDAQTPVAS